MLLIDRMRIQLPAGFEHRASNISDLIGESMSEFQPKENKKLDNLSIGPIHISSNASDHDIARNVVEQMTAILRRDV